MLLVLAGCDRLFGLGDLPPLPADAAVTGDARADAAATGDAFVGPCTPASFQAATPTAFVYAVDHAAVATDESFAVFTKAGTVYYVAPLEGAPQAASISGANWAFPALTSDDVDLFLSHTGPVTEEAVHETAAMFATPGTVSGLPADSVPGRPAGHDGSLDMVVGLNGGFEELGQTAGTWLEHGVYDATMLAGIPGTLQFGNLSSDGLTLVFAVYASTGSGVYFWHRNDPAVLFGATATDPHGQLLAGAFASPTLTPDCSTLYVVDQTSGVLVRYHQ